MINQSKFRGFTLVELMITLLLSLTITYGISQVLISSNKSALSADGMSQSQETGRFVISFLAKHIREAGRNTIKDNLPEGEDTIITTPAFISCSKFDELEVNECISEGVGGKDQDSIKAITDPPHGDRLAVSVVTTTDRLKDCTGSTVYTANGASVTTPYKINDIIINKFWVEFDNTSQMNSLFCQGHLFNGKKVLGSSPQQAIANGVEAIHFLYGEATAPLPATKSRNVSKYVAADDVEEWDQVYAVRVSIMTRSITNATNKNTPRKYVLLDAEPYEMTDTINRQVFTTTFTINNYEKK